MRDYKYHEDTFIFFQMKSVTTSVDYCPDETSFDALYSCLYGLPLQRKIDTIVEYVRDYDPCSMPDKLDSPLSCGSSAYEADCPLTIALPEEN